MSDTKGEEIHHITLSFQISIQQSLHPDIPAFTIVLHFCSHKKYLLPTRLYVCEEVRSKLQINSYSCSYILPVNDIDGSDVIFFPPLLSGKHVN